MLFRYLQVIMGNVDVSILDKNAKYVYKEQYESFKLIINLIGNSTCTRSSTSPSSSSSIL